MTDDNQTHRHVRAQLDAIARQNREITAAMIARRAVRWTMTRLASDEVKKNLAKENRNK